MRRGRGTPGRSTRLTRWGVAGVALLVLAGLGALVVSRLPWVVLGAEGYVFGYPLVIVDVTRDVASQTLGPENRLRPARRFPDARFRDVVRPNVDTLYVSAFIDLGLGPWVFDMPPNAERYELMCFLDAWTNVFAAPGTRTSGTQGGRYLLAGPDWQGGVPPGLTLLRAPTRMVWLIGRTQALGEADMARVHRLQDGLSLRRLAEAPADRPATEPAWRAAATPPLPPVTQLERMSTEAFFTRLAVLMAANPPASGDAPMMAKLARLGVAPGRPPAWGVLDRASVSLGRWIADRAMARELARPRDLVNGWSTPPAVLGQYGQHYNLRAAVAKVGLGANLPADTLYLQARVDHEGRELNGSKRYRVRFEPGQSPPVSAFWSLTAYGLDNFLLDVPGGRHAVGHREPPVANPDGAIELLVQADPPDSRLRANWLPVREGEPFTLMARLYWPAPPALDGRWRMPVVQRLP